MRADFWNNPILVTSVRRRFRGTWALQFILMYPLILMLVGAMLPYFFPRMTQDWPYYGFVVLMVFQYASSGLIASASTSQTMKAEVANQTLDFLRLTPLSARQILLGKLLGAVTFPLFTAIASFPVGVLCWALGGIPSHAFVLLYFNLLVYVVASGSCGMVMRLELRDDKRVDANLMMVFGWATGLACLAPISMAEPARAIALSLVPVPLLMLAYLNFHIMVRSLESPLKPPVSKPVAYVLLLIMSVAAGVGVNVFFFISPGQRAVAYWVVAMAFAAYLTIGVTAWREVLRSWVWRFRGRVPRRRDAWLGDRTGNGAALLTLVLIVLLGYVAVFLPVAWTGAVAFREELPALAGTAVLSVAMLFCFGTLFQWASLVAGRSGQGLGLFLLFLAGIPQFVGQVQDLPWVTQLGPIGHFVSWHRNPEQMQPLLPLLLGAMLVVGFVAWRSQRFLLARMEQAIERKLERMGVLERPGRAREAGVPGEANAAAATEQPG